MAMALHQNELWSFWKAASLFLNNLEMSCFNLGLHKIYYTKLKLRIKKHHTT